MLAQREGLDCAGAFMSLQPGESSGTAEEDARASATQLGIPFYTLDLSEDFTRHVIGRFIDEYRCGRTPNPCVDCNRSIKFGRLMQEARKLGKDVLVTGHYAQIERDAGGRYLLKKGADPLKDQSYVLYSLDQEQLGFTSFPLGGFSKTQVRDIALGIGLDIANKRESQDICFVPGGDYAGFITEYTGEPARGCRLIDEHGNYLGPGKGVMCYTVGQRRGIGLALPYPAYVLEVRPDEDAVVVGRDELLYSRTLHASKINLIPLKALDVSIRASVKIRYKQAEQPATIHQTDEDALRVEFDKPQRAIARGQAAVIYDGDYVIGGGTIV
jgi:tRNA-specific 2-thiouridylase